MPLNKETKETIYVVGGSCKSLAFNTSYMDDLQRVEIGR